MFVADGSKDLCPVGLGTQFGRCPDLKQTDSTGYRTASLGYKAHETRSQRLGSTAPRQVSHREKGGAQAERNIIDI